jgi:hypothetical protein
MGDLEYILLRGMTATNMFLYVGFFGIIGSPWLSGVIRAVLGLARPHFNERPGSQVAVPDEA